MPSWQVSTQDIRTQLLMEGSALPATGEPSSSSQAATMRALYAAVKVRCFGRPGLPLLT